MLIEAAWSYRYPARIAKEKAEILVRLPKNIRDIAWKAQTRLCTRYRSLIVQGQEAYRGCRCARAGTRRLHLGNRPGDEDFRKKHARKSAVLAEYKLISHVCDRSNDEEWPRAHAPKKREYHCDCRISSSVIVPRPASHDGRRNHIFGENKHHDPH